MKVKLTRAMLNQNLSIQEGNDKLVGDEGCVFLTWSLVPIKTCPYATALCKHICYAVNDELWKRNVRESRQRNFEESFKATFVADMIQCFEYELIRPKFRGKHIFVRFHVAGDIYSQAYCDKLVAIAEHFKGNDRISFQAYTKSLPYLRKYDLSQVNIKFVYSIMNDTKKADIAEAEALGLTTFKAKPRGSELQADEIACNGECGRCTLCYDGKDGLKIAIPYHGYRKSYKA